MRSAFLLATVLVGACTGVRTTEPRPPPIAEPTRHEAEATPAEPVAADIAPIAAAVPVPEHDPVETERAPERPVAPAPSAPPGVRPLPASPPVTPSPATASLSGRIDLVQAHEIAGGPVLLAQTWVAFRPRTPVSVTPGEELRMLTRLSQFQPQTMAVTVGTTVRFPNLDRILHNVFSLSPGNSFDVGLYGPGTRGEAHTFTRPGFAEIFCNVHPNMAAFLWVLDTPHFSRVDADGSFRIEGVPAVGGALEVWNHRAELVSVPAVAPDDGLRVTLRISKPPVPQHTNKLGEAY